MQSDKTVKGVKNMVILSDLSEVLIHGFYGTEEVVAERYGKMVAERFWLRHLEINEDFVKVLRGDHSEDCHWLKFLSKGEWPFNVNEVKDCFSENLKKSIPGTFDVYKNINSFPLSFGENLRIVEGRPEIYITSDHITERISEVKRYHPDIFLMATKHYWSCYMGIVKGDKGFFERVLAENNLQPDEVLFIDDMPRNIEKAEKLGIKSLQFHNSSTLKHEMEKLGFTFRR